MTTPINVAELWRGVRTGEGERLAAVVDALQCVPLERGEGELAGAMLRRYAGEYGMGLADALIAAIAIEYEVPLWTRNRKYFPMPEVRFYEP